MTLLNPPPSLIKQLSYFMTSILIIKAISMKGALLINFSYDLIFFMKGVPIIKVISVKGAIPIQSQLSHHPQLTLTAIYKDLSWYLN